MTYLAFVLATGLYFVMGSGGPLHGDGWFKTIQQRVEATTPPIWLGLALLILAPCFAVWFLANLLTGMLGGLGTLIAGTAMLFFAFGRQSINFNSTAQICLHEPSRSSGHEQSQLISNELRTGGVYVIEIS